MRALAAARGGGCLAETYRPDPETMPFRCAEGHTWESTSERIKIGIWCPRCAGKGMTIADMNALAAKHGGRCVSKRYRHSRKPLEWECHEGHRFRLMPLTVKAGGWCPTCQAEVRVVERAIRRVESKGGALVSTVDPGPDADLNWRCPLGHDWTARPRVLQVRGWCPTCQPPVPYRLTLAEMQELARINGGRCLSKKYVNSVTKLEWECAKGHRWRATPSSIKHQDSWCPECGIERRKTTRRANRKDLL